jgi:hypothetical protein
MPTFAPNASADDVPAREIGGTDRAYSDHTQEIDVDIVNIDTCRANKAAPPRKFFKPREEEPPRKYPRLENGQILAKNSLPEGFPELITALYSDVKVWYEKSRKMEGMHEEERSRCASLQAQVAQLEGELSRNRAHAQKVVELASPLVITSQHAIDAWQEKTRYLQQCILGLGSFVAEEAEAVDHTPAVGVDEPAMDEASGGLHDHIEICSFYGTTVVGTEQAHAVSTRGLEFMLQQRDGDRATVDQTIHLFNIKVGEHAVMDKYGRRISNGFCVLQYDLQRCLRKAFGDPAVKNFGNHTQKTNKFVLPKAVLVSKLTDVAVDELTSKKIIMRNKPNQEFCFIPYADVEHVLTKFAQHNCRQQQTTARLLLLQSMLEKFYRRYCCGEEVVEGQGEAVSGDGGQEWSVERTDAVSCLPEPSHGT